MSEQPIPKKGTTFAGWAAFNWGQSRGEVHRTRKAARESCCDPGQTWNDVKDHMAVVKVKCIVI